MATYLDKPIASVRISEPTPGAGMTRDGYTRLSGAPTRYRVTLLGEKCERRVYCWQFSNAGTLFVRIMGAPMLLTTDHEATLRKARDAR